MKKLFRRVLSAAAALTLSAAPLTGALAYADVDPNPVISRNCPVYTGSDNYSKTFANDEHYYSFWNAATPDYLAYDLSDVPESERKQIIAVWYNTSAYDNIGNYVNRNMEPSDYTIEINAAEGGEYPEDGWVVAKTVTGNTLSSRQHLIDFEGYNWIRMNISAADDESGKQASINLDIHNVSDGVSDSWIFFGDSITAGGMNNCYGTGFATFVNRLDERYFPIQENGGIGGITSTDGRNNIDRWLSTYPGKYVSIAYGTNDAWGNQTGAQTYYENTKYMIDAILALGKTPILPKIPYSLESGINTYLDDYNAMVDKLWEEYGDRLVQGPDFDAYFRENPDGLGTDGVHPNDTGYEAMRKLWAETMYENVYSAESDTIIYGDANGDGDVTMADAVLILQAQANPDKYGVDGTHEEHITAQGLANADCSGGGDGLTAMDALAVQKYLLKIIDKLPED